MRQKSLLTHSTVFRKVLGMQIFFYLEKYILYSTYCKMIATAISALFSLCTLQSTHCTKVQCSVAEPEEPEAQHFWLELKPAYTD